MILVLWAILFGTRWDWAKRVALSATCNPHSLEWGGCCKVDIITTFLCFPSSSCEINAATSLISVCLMTPSAESQNLIDVSVRSANSQWCRTQSGIKRFSPVVDCLSHFMALLGVVVAVGKNSGLTNGIPVSFSNVLKNNSRSVLDQSAPLANFFDDGIGLCGI